mmetsp:Transcript_16606/g.42577  ORF Transcript_16606/g.42577 Transcript_16606/m.42577 type:complete len:115 (+) Transcript_16606:1181-1525(+)
MSELLPGMGASVAMCVYIIDSLFSTIHAVCVQTAWNMPRLVTRLPRYVRSSWALPFKHGCLASENATPAGVHGLGYGWMFGASCAMAAARQQSQIPAVTTRAHRQSARRPHDRA